MKKIVSKILMMLMLMTCVVPMTARADDSEVSEIYLSVSEISGQLGIDGTTASGGISVIGKNGTTRIYGWIDLVQIDASGNKKIVTSWSNLSSSDEFLYKAVSYTVTPGYMYRLDATMAVTANGLSEAVKFSTNEVYCK